MTFQKIAELNQVEEGQPFCTQINGREVALFKIMGRFFALANACSHAGGPLCKGSLSGQLTDQVVTCPWHGSGFDVTTGAVVNGPAKRPQLSYEVRVSGQDIEIAL